MDRRDFIKLTAVTGTGAALTACGNPEHQLIRFVPDEDIVPGIAEWKPSVCPMCAAGCGLNVRVMDADFETSRNGQTGVVAIKAAKKLEGQPSHSVNRGRLCARGQAAIQLTYHPDRLTGPRKRSGARGSGEFTSISWDDAIAELVARLDGMSDRKALAFVTGGGTGRRHELVGEFVAKFGAPPPIAFEVFGEEVLRRANAISFGRQQLPTFDLARADFAISFGADFLGTWNSPVANAGGLAEMRQGQPGYRGKFVQVEPRMSLSGASADEWIPIKPGTEGVFALGLAQVLVANGLVRGDAGLFNDYTPDAVEKLTGVAARRVERLGRELADRRPAVAMIGGAALAHTNGLFHAVAVNMLNTLLDSISVEGGVLFTPQPPALTSNPSARSAKELRDLRADVLMLDGANPVFGSPDAWKIREVLDRVPFIVSFGSFVDDTSARADLLLPDHSFLESWVDSVPESGTGAMVMNAAGPVMRPLYQTRAMPDVLIEIAGKLKTPIALPWKSFDEMLKASFDKVDPNAWDQATEKGFWQRTGQESSTAPPAARNRKPGSSAANDLKFTAPAFDGDAAAYPFHFLPYASPAFYDGSSAHLPWLQELPDPLTSAMWCSWIEVNPQTAAKLGVADGDIVEVASTQGSLRAPVVISPGTAPDVVAMPVGQGHQNYTRYASRRGVNPLAILAPLTEAETGSLAWAATRVKLTRAGGPDGSLILFAGEMRENPHEGGRR